VGGAQNSGMRLVLPIQLQNHHSLKLVEPSAWTTKSRRAPEYS
jgi:hypothetical protein